MIINDRNPRALPYDQAHALPYDQAIDLAFKLNLPGERHLAFLNDPDWHYRVDIDATTGMAKIAVLENNELLGYI